MAPGVVSAAAIDSIGPARWPTCLRSSPSSSTIPTTPRRSTALVDAARHTPPDVRATRFASARKLLARPRPARCGRPADRRRARGDRRRSIARSTCCSRRAWCSTASCSTCRRRAPRSTRSARCGPTTRWRRRRSASSTSPRRTGRSSPTSTSRRRARRPIAASRPGSTCRRPRPTCGSRPTRPRPRRYLRKALEIDPKNAQGRVPPRAAAAPRRALGAISRSCSRSAPSARRRPRRRSRRCSGSPSVARDRLDDPARADAAIKRVLALDPAQPQALRAVTDALQPAQNWPALVARRTRPRSRRARRRRPRHAAADRDGAVEARRRSRSGRGVLPAGPQARAGAPGGARLLPRVLPGEGRERRSCSRCSARSRSRARGATASERTARGRSRVEIAELAERRTTPRRRSRPGSSTCAASPTSQRGAHRARAAVSADREVERAARSDEGRDRAAARGRRRRPRRASCSRSSRSIATSCGST